MFRSRAAIAAGMVAAVLTASGSASAAPSGPAPNCENGRSHAWANDPQGDPFHGGQQFNCSIGAPPGS